MNEEDVTEDPFLSIMVGLEPDRARIDSSFMEIEAYIRNAENEHVLMKKVRLTVNHSTYYQPEMMIPLTDICDETKNLVKDNSLTFILLLSLRYESPILEIPQPSKLFNTEKLSDIKIKCNDRVIPAHRFILYEQSDVFARMLDAQMEEATTNEVIIDEIEGNVIFEMVRYIYTGSLEDDNLHVIVLDLLVAAEKYQLLNLKSRCIKACSKYMEKATVIQMLVLADRLGEQILMENCISYIRL